ncbi:MAG: TIGR02147 family protein [Fibrobacterota bacterium]|nr:MAG: TIGR02147 family protein [Fibrobacterota bacterium]
MDALEQATDYRPWLDAALKDIRRRHPSRTKKALAQVLEIDPAHLSHILAGQKHLALRHLPQVAKFLELSPPQARYFNTLVRLNSAQDSPTSHQAFLELRQMRGDLQRNLSDDTHEYFTSWLHPAMRTLLSLVEFRGLGWTRLAGLFRKGVTPDQARLSVELLLRLGLLERDPRGILRPTGGTVSSGEKWLGQAVMEFQRQTIALSGELLEATPKSERDVSTLTLPASRERMDELKDKIRQFRQEVISWARDLPEEDIVVQLNIQLFPVADARRTERSTTEKSP